MLEGAAAIFCIKDAKKLVKIRVFGIIKMKAALAILERKSLCKRQL